MIRYNQAMIISRFPAYFVIFFYIYRIIHYLSFFFFNIVAIVVIKKEIVLSVKSILNIPSGARHSTFSRLMYLIFTVVS